MAVCWLSLILGVLIVNTAPPCVYAISSTARNVLWLENGSSVERKTQETMDVYCYKGKTKTLSNLWSTPFLLLNISTDSFKIYEAGSPEEVWNAYREDNYVWFYKMFSSTKSRTFKLNPFNSTCLVIAASDRYHIALTIQNPDYFKITIFAFGVVLFLCSTFLSKNKMFFYGVGILIGIFASYMIVIYLICKMMPGKSMMYGSMVGGWAVGLYFFNFVWSNFHPMLVTYKEYVIWYTIIMAFVSFIACYKIGSPKDKRNQNIISWILQAIGLLAVYYSTNASEAVLAISVVLFVVKYVPFSWLRIFKFKLRSSPPQRRLLTEEEYYEEGVRETAKALEELRGYCSSPDCNQWKLMLQLNDSARFAKFVSGETHVTEQEYEDYDSDDFVIRRPSNDTKKNGKPTVTSSYNEDDFTSDDSSLSEDDL